MELPYTLHTGDCREVMATFAPESVDAIVSDPPYGLSFMGREWDHGVPGVTFWAEALRVAKPGAHLVAFGGSRTFHRLTCAVEDAGWEIRDVLMWLYGSGFPKSLDVSKAIDKEAGVWRGRSIGIASANAAMGGQNYIRQSKGEPRTAAAREWSGWGTALKPAYEPIILARKPLRGTVARNVQAHGTGAINVDGCRIGTSKRTPGSAGTVGNTIYGAGLGAASSGATGTGFDPNIGRWPANVLLDEAAAAVLDAQSGETSFHPAGCFAHGQPAGWSGGTNNIGRSGDGTRSVFGYGDRGGASRFFYTSKASGEDRARWAGNDHPTVKPTDLMRWLCRLVTPPGGLILDPFMGSGSTGVAAVEEGFRFVGVDLEARHVEIAERRLRHAARQPDLFGAMACP